MPVFDDLDDSDFFIVHAREGSSQPYRKNILASTLRSYSSDTGQANVVSAGGRNDGSEDIVPVIAEIIANGYSPYIPHGDYLWSSTLSVSAEATITFEKGFIPNYAINNSTPISYDPSDYGQCRLIADGNRDFFNISWGGIAIQGFPLLDVSNLASFTSYGVKYLCAETTYRRIWHGWLELMALGNHSTLATEGEGMKMIGCEWDLSAGGLNDNSYITMARWFIYAQDVAYGFYLPARYGGSDQFANSIEAWMYLDGCKQAVYNASFNASKWRGYVQARDILHANETPSACGWFDGASDNEWGVKTFDPSASQGSNGNYRISYSLQNDGRGNFKTPGVDLNGDVRGFLLQDQWHTEYAPRGIVPPVQRKIGGAIGWVDLDRVNPLGCLPLRATTYDATAYDGSEVADFSALTDDSATATITESTDITLSKFDTLNGVITGTASYPTATANSTAVSNGDYVEIHFTGWEFRGNEFWLAFTSDGGFAKAQIITKASSVVVDNTGEVDLPPQNDEDPVNLVKIPLSSNTDALADEGIIRLIEPRNTTAVTIHGIAVTGNYLENKSRYVDVQGGKTIYGTMSFDSTVDMDALPTSDPGHAGRLWVDGSGFVKLSAG